MKIELFNVTYRPGLTDAPLSLICQAVDINDEKFVWLDGLYPNEPVLVSLSSCSKVEWLGSFDEVIKGHEELAAQVLKADRGENTPTILARAVIYMRNDRSLDGVAALSLAVEQGLHLARADRRCEARLAEHLVPS